MKSLVLKIQSSNFRFRILLFCIVFLLCIPSLHAQESIEIFAPEPLAKEESRGRNIATCLAGLNDFLGAALGTESVKDYFRDFFLWPLHYADVARIENQLNKARYAVITTFLRCDLNRLTAVKEAYYKLEAELYFVRHFVDTSGGYLHILIEQPDDREKFAEDMVKRLFLRKRSEDQDRDRAIFRGYFDVFEGKYKERAKSYKSFGNDPVYQELGKKFDELISSFRSLVRAEPGQEAEKEKPVSEKPAAQKEITPSLHTGSSRNIREKAAAFLGKFVDACVETSDLGRFDVTRSETTQKENRYCLFAGKSLEDPFAQPLVKKTSEKRTFEEVTVAIRKQEFQKTEDLDRAQMLARYELLYGQVNGAGITDVLSKLETLNAILGKGTEGKPTEGSLLPLKELKECAATALSQECK